MFADFNFLKFILLEYGILIFCKVLGDCNNGN